MLREILNKSWRQHPTQQQLYGHLLPITETIKTRRTRHAGHFWRSRDELIIDILQWTPSNTRVNQGDQLEPTYANSVPIRDVALKNCLKQWTIERGKERGSVISVLIAWHHDDDIYTHKWIITNFLVCVFLQHLYYRQETRQYQVFSGIQLVWKQHFFLLDWLP